MFAITRQFAAELKCHKISQIAAPTSQIVTECIFSGFDKPDIIRVWKVKQSREILVAFWFIKKKARY